MITEQKNTYILGTKMKIQTTKKYVLFESVQLV